MIDYEKVLDEGLIGELRLTAKWLRTMNCNAEADLMRDAADVIEELISRLPKWISVNEHLPVSQELVIVSVCDTTGDTEFSYTSFGWLTSEKEYWIADGEENGYVTHWMKLPEPSKGE